MVHEYESGCIEFVINHRLVLIASSVANLIHRHSPIATMVRVTEVSDDAWSSASSDAGSDLDSVISDSDLQLDTYDPSQETFAERIAALKDIVSPSTRAAISDAASSTKGWLSWSVAKAGNAAWIVTTSALLVGLPLLLSIEGEAAIVQQEKEFAAQPGANPYGAPLAGSFPGQPAPQAGAAPQGIVPAGF
ncbi:mitochondrial import receptor subunit Tom22 [Rhodotorula toruloides]